jgi:hypothetical protein
VYLLLDLVFPYPPTCCTLVIDRQGGAGSAVKAEVTTSTRKPKKGADDIIDVR